MTLQLGQPVADRFQQRSVANRPPACISTGPEAWSYSLFNAETHSSQKGGGHLASYDTE